MKLLITQSTQGEETVNPSVVATLYQLAVGLNSLDPLSDVMGKIYVSLTYENYVSVLHNRFPNLDIRYTSLYVAFEDSSVESVIRTKLNIPAGSGITLSDIENVQSIAISNSTGWFSGEGIEYFDEYRYFTGLTHGSLFYGFGGCPQLKRITFPKLTGTIQAPTAATYLFNEEASSLEYANWNGNVVNSIPHNLYKGCSSLIYNENILPKGATSVGDSIFLGCSSLDKMIFYEGMLTFSSSMFRDCTSALEYVELPSTTTDINTFWWFLNLNQTPPTPVIVIKATTVPHFSTAYSANNSWANVDVYVPNTALTQYLQSLLELTNNAGNYVSWQSSVSFKALSTLPQAYLSMGTISDPSIYAVS